MKHIKKRYAFESDSIPSDLEGKIELNHQFDENNLAKGVIPLILTNEGLYVRTFKYSTQGEHIVIPIPDLTLVYLDSSYNLNKLRKEEESKLLKKLKVTQDKLGEQAINEIYRFYGYSASCVISLFTALESFINHLIPDDAVYRKIQNNRTELYNKEQIQRYIQFEQKIFDVLPSLNFQKYQKTSPSYKHIENLKSLRDEIVHTKADKNLKQQEELVKKLLRFKFDETLDSIAKFMNAFRSGYVEECNCGTDY